MARHLTQDERYQVEALWRLDFSITAISRRLCRHPSTISRELRRNQRGQRYTAVQAQCQADARRRRASQRARIPHHVWPEVEARLRLEHSPEQIAGRTKLVSHERIYQHVAADRRSGGDLYRHLRHGRTRLRRCRPDRRGQIRFRRDISERPACVEERSDIGHWEIDTIVKANGGEVLVTMTERRSQVHLIRRAANRSARAVTRTVVQALYPLRDQVKTITSDNGKEFTDHEVIALILEADYYFARPYASWQRGSNENGNGLVRQYFPKGTDFATVTDERIREVERRINNRPRKTLCFNTPLELFFEETQCVAIES